MEVKNFNKIIPMPQELKGTRSPIKIISDQEYQEQESKIEKGELSQEEKMFGISRNLTQKLHNEYMINYGADNWYDWSCNNWGTKWNACETISKKNYIQYTTAWSSPLPIIAKLSELFPNVYFELFYADENAGYNTGAMIAREGELYAEEIEENSVRSWNLYFELHPHRKSDLNLKMEIINIRNNICHILL